MLSLYNWLVCLLISWLVSFGLLEQSSRYPRTKPSLCISSLLNALQAADVYSFGVLLWEMLTSSRAWAGLQHARIMCMVGMLRQSLAVPEGLPQELSSLLSQCLDADPTARPSFTEVSHRLSSYLQESRSQLQTAGANLPLAAARQQDKELPQQPLTG